MRIKWGTCKKTGVVLFYLEGELFKKAVIDWVLIRNGNRGGTCTKMTIEGVLIRKLICAV